MTDDHQKSERVTGDPAYRKAEEIVNGKIGGEYVYSVEENCFYVYNKGFWHKIYECEFIKTINKSLPSFKNLTLSQKKQVIENIKTIKDLRLDKFNWSHMLNLSNGMLSPKDKTFLDHESILYSTMRLPYEYKEDASCDLWLKTLNEILENDKNKIEILQEFFGYCLTRDTKYHKALLLLGESRSGKSTILSTLRAMIGENNCSSVPLKYIANPQCTSMLVNKLVNIDTDVSAKAVEFEAEFKTITSGEPLHSNQKYILPFDFIPFCKLIMAANIFPRITDHSSAFYNRLILVPCDRVFEPKEQNKDLPEQLKSELSGILNWSLEGLNRIQERKGFKEYDFMNEAVKELEDDNNPINLFFDEHIEIDLETYIEKGELYEKYKLWTEKTKNFTLSSPRFSSCLFKEYHKVTFKKSRLPEGQQKRIWKNLKYVDFKSEIKPQMNWQEVKMEIDLDENLF